MFHHPSLFRCPCDFTCTFRCRTSNDMKYHLRAQHDRQALPTNFSCPDCATSYTRMTRYLKHLSEHESELDQESSSAAPVAEPQKMIPDVEMEIDNVNAQLLEKEADKNIETLLRRKKRALVNGMSDRLRAQGQFNESIHNIVTSGFAAMVCDRYSSLSVVVEAIQIAEALISLTMRRARQIVSETIKQHNSESNNPITEEQSEYLVEHVKEAFEEIQNPISHLNERRKLEKLFEDSSTYVKPKLQSFMRNEYVNRFVGPDKDEFETSENKMDYTYYAMNGRKHLKVFFEAHPWMLDGLVGPERGPAPEVLSRAVDGEFIRDRINEFERPGRKIVCIKISNDDVTIADRSERKESVYQMGITNLPAYTTPNPATQFMLAIGDAKNFAASYSTAKEPTRKKIGHDIVCERLAEQFKRWETKGFYVRDSRYKNSKGEPIKVKLHIMFTLIGCDNLAQHLVLRFAGSFSMTNFPCVICRIHHNQLGTQFDNFTLLTQPLYEIYAERADRSFALGIKEGRDEQKLTGINGICRLSGTYWDLTDNKYVDIMHDADEGMCQHSLKYVFRGLVNNEDKPWIDTVLLNCAVKAFRIGRTDSSNKTHKLRVSALETKQMDKVKFDKNNKLNLNKKKASDTGLGMKAMQTYTFIRLLPEIISPALIPRNSSAWRVLMQLRMICMCLHDDKQTREQLNVFNAFLQKHIECLQKCCPSFKIKPKYHFLFHFVLCCLMHGAAMQHSCYMYERNLAQAVKAAKCCSNSKNISWTIAKRRQYALSMRQLWQLADNDKYVIMGPLWSLSDDRLSKMPHNMRELLGGEDCKLCSTFELRGYKYLSETAMLRRYDYNGLPEIVKIVGFVVDGDIEDQVLVSKIYVINLMEDVMCGAYVVRDEELHYELIDLRDCRDYHPFDLYKQNNETSHVYLYTDSTWLTDLSLGHFVC